MSRQGVSMPRQEVDKFLKEGSTRRLRVDEHLAMAAVFGVPAHDMTRPIAEVSTEAIRRASDRVERASEHIDNAFNEWVEAWLDWRQEMYDQPEGYAMFESLLTSENPPRLAPSLTITDNRIDSIEIAEWQQGDVHGPLPGLQWLWAERAGWLGVGSAARSDLLAKDVPDYQRAKARAKGHGAPGPLIANALAHLPRWYESPSDFLAEPVVAELENAIDAIRRMNKETSSRKVGSADD